MNIRFLAGLFLLILVGVSSVSAQSPRDESSGRRRWPFTGSRIVIDTHNDVTTAMTNDDYDLSGAPPVPYRTSIERMKQAA